MLLDKEFLKQLDHSLNKTKYVRLIALDKEERPIETIEGRATGGSINIDGASKKQRTCSGITLLGQDLKINDTNWAMKTKFKVEIGLKNDIDSCYPDIIWFKQGTYGINSFSISESTNNFTVNISGQDKMGYLDGTFGGTLPMQVNFGVEDYIQPNGNIISTKIPLYKIIQQAVHQYGGEPLHNIIINDLDQSGYELWDYRGGSENTKDASPIYYFYFDGKVQNMTFNENMIVYRENDTSCKLSELSEEDLYVPNSIFETGAKFKLLKDKTDYKYKISKIQYGDTAGYHRTPLVYAGDLILNAGEALTSLLDKIVAMLGEYEYFYNLEGQFIFQKKKNYIQELLTPLNGETFDPVVNLSKYNYEFDDQVLLSNVSRNPNIKDTKNDFVIWGNRKNATGADLPIHLRLAVAHKPTSYVVPKNYYERYFLYNIEVIEGTKELPSGYEWYIKDNDTYRPATKEEITSTINLVYIKESYTYYKEKNNNILYYKKNNKYYLHNAKQKLYERNSNSHQFEIYNFPTFKENENIASISSELFVVKESKETKYVSFDYETSPGLEYINLIYVDWRELIYLMARDYYQHNEELDYNKELQKHNAWCKNGKTGFEPFYADMQAFWRLLYYPNWSPEIGDGINEYLQYGKYQWWNYNAIYSPASLIFWIDFIDTYGELEQYSIENIGVRTKVENKNDITSLFYEKTPEVEFIINPTETYNYNLQNDMAYEPLWISDSVQELFTISGRGISASEWLDNLVYKYLCCSESVSLTSVPIYYLQPNTRIYIKDEKVNIDGDYLLNKITIPLSYNGTMSLSATKVIKQLEGVLFTPSLEHSNPYLLLIDRNEKKLTDNNKYNLLVKGE